MSKPQSTSELDLETMEIEEFSELLKQGKINAKNKDEEGLPILFRYVFPSLFGHADLLRAYGADINEIDDEGMSMLMYASIFQNQNYEGVNGLEIAKYLTENKADPNLRSQGKTALQFLEERSESIKLAKLLIRAGAIIEPNKIAKNSVIFNEDSILQGLMEIIREFQEDPHENIEYLFPKECEEYFQSIARSAILIALQKEDAELLRKIITKESSLKDKPYSEIIDPKLIEIVDDKTLLQEVSERLNLKDVEKKDQKEDHFSTPKNAGRIASYYGVLPLTLRKVYDRKQGAAKRSLDPELTKATHDSKSTSEQTTTSSSTSESPASKNITTNSPESTTKQVKNSSPEAIGASKLETTKENEKEIG